MSADFAIVFADKSGEPQTNERMRNFVAALEVAAHEHGFKWSTMGTRAAVRRSFADEQARFDAEDTAAMLAEFRARRDADEEDERALQSIAEDASL